MVIFGLPYVLHCPDHNGQMRKKPRKKTRYFQRLDPAQFQNAGRPMANRETFIQPEQQIRT